MSKKSERRERLMPNGVPRYVRCYDNGGETADRYTVVYTGNYTTTGAKRDRTRKMWFQYVGMSGAPFHPQGICQHGESQDRIDVTPGSWAGPSIGRKNHLGTRIRFEDLPEDCKKVVIDDYEDLWDLKEVK